MNGGVSSSTTTATRGSRRSARPFAVSTPVLNNRSGTPAVPAGAASSSTNQMGVTRAAPSRATKASFAVRVPVRRKSVTSWADI